MSFSLRERVADTARAAERLRWLYAGLRWGAGSAGTIVILGTIDALWRGYDVGTRLLLSAAAVASLIALAWRYFRPLYLRHDSPLEIARRIDRLYPQLENRLASALAFQGEAEKDPLAGSPELRRQVIAQAESRASDVDFRAILDDAPVRRAARVALLIALGVALLIGLAPRTFATAVMRLALPLAHVEWPRQYRLQWIESPRYIALGQDLELVLGGKLPDRVELQLYYPASGQTDRREMRPLDGKMTYRIENVTEGFRYRATGGDDDSLPWIDLATVAAPEVDDLTTTVTAPSYTGWPAQRGERVVRVLSGSQVVITGRADRVLQSVRLTPDKSQGMAIAGQLSADDATFRIPADQPLVLRESSRWWLEVEDKQGVLSRQQESMDFIVVADEPPAINWKTPLDNTYLTPQAKLPIAAAISDDLGISGVELRVWRGEANDAPLQVAELYRTEDRSTLVAGLEQMAVGVRQPIEDRWIVQDALPSLQSGDSLTFRLAASDFLPQVTETPPRRLLVISVEEYQERARQRQGALLTQLTEVAGLMRTARLPTREVELRWEQAATAGPSDAARLQHAEFNQRQVQHLLGEPEQGIDVQVERLLDDLQANQLGATGLARQSDQLHMVTDRLRRELLPQAALSLGAALKELRTQPPDAQVAPPRELLKAAGQAQDQAIDSLDTILAQLNQWDTLARLTRDIGRVQEEQQALRHTTEQLRLNLAAADGEQLPERIAESKQLAQQQFDLTRQFDRTFVRIAELHRKLPEEERPNETAVSESLANALSAARRTGVSGLMQEAGRGLAAQRISSAAESQARAIDGLTAVLDALLGRAEQEMKKRVEQLEAAAGQLTDLIARQDRERQAADQAAANANADQRRRQLDRVGRSEALLAEEVQEVRQMLEGLHSQPAARRAAEAADKLAAAASTASRGEAEATRQAAREALRALEETGRQLQAAIAQAQADLVQEEMARLEQLVGGLVGKQQSLLEETQRLEALRKEAGGWQRAQLAALQTVAAGQRSLADETRELSGGLQSPAFALALRGVSQEMQLAASGLDRSDAADVTQQAQRLALRRLQQLLQVLDEAEAPPANDPPPLPGEEHDAQPPNVQSVNELKLLLLLQQELNRRTRELEERRTTGELPDADLSRQLANLAVEQGRVAEIVQNLLTRSQADADPKTLPHPKAPADNDE